MDTIQKDHGLDNDVMAKANGAEAIGNNLLANKIIVDNDGRLE